MWTVYTAASIAAQHAATSGVQRKENGKFTLFSGLNRSLLRRQPGAIRSAEQAWQLLDCMHAQ